METTHVRVPATSIEVSAWIDTPTPPVGKPHKRAAKKPVYAPEWFGTFLGLSGTLLLHALAFQTIALGAHSHKTKPAPKVQGPGAISRPADTDPTMTLVTVQLPGSTSSDDQLAQDIGSVGSAAKDMPVTILSADALPNVEISNASEGESENSNDAINSGDPARRAALFGIYSGQIDARIERAWLRPRSPVNEDRSASPFTNMPRPTVPTAGAGTFKCQARIVQDREGNVQEVLLLKCNGTPQWQQSLVTAIFQASPLPAPPTPTVFSNSVTLSFEAAEYSARAAADGYEPERAPLAQAAIQIRTDSARTDPDKLNDL